MKDNRKVALVLSGGGARGIAHIGVIEELEKRGFEITSIAGTSMGSLIGGAYAAGKMDALKNWIYTLDKAKVFGLVDFTLSKQGLIKADKALKKMKEYVPDMPIEELSLPYAAVAVDLVNNKEVVYREGSLYRAIRASIAIPGVITPVKEDKHLLVDGGVLNNIPLAHVTRQAGDLMVAVYVNADIPPDLPRPTKDSEKKLKLYQKKIADFYAHLTKTFSSSGDADLGYFSLASTVFDLMTMRMAEDRIKEYAPEVLIRVSRESCNVFDFYKAEQQVEAGRRAAIKVLDSL
jgi:NTE family protein